MENVMLRKIGFAMLCATGLFSSTVFSATEHAFRLTGGYEFALPPNEPQLFTNYFFWTIDAKCTVVSEKAETTISFTVLRKSGKLNGISLYTGDAMALVVQPGDVLNISAASGGQIELTNLGDEEIKANCVSGK
jgi:hypothetical protein